MNWSIPISLLYSILLTIILGTTTDAAIWQEWLSIAILAYATFSLRSRPWRTIEVAYIGVSAVVLYICLAYFSNYNGIILFGVWLFSIQALRSWLTNSDINKAKLISINILMSAAMLISVADMNGVAVHMAGLPQSTTFGLYDSEDPNYRLIERSQDYKHPSRKSEQIRLHSPVAGADLSAVRLRLKPARQSKLFIRSIEISNFIGFDGKPVKKFEGESLLNLITASKIPARLENTIVVVGPVEGNVWINIANTPSEFTATQFRSLHAVLYWQIGFLILLLLTPGRIKQIIPPSYTPLIQRIPWWLWTSIIHLFFISILAWVIFYVFNVSELNDRTVPLNLAHEGNYAVWWSGICLFMASLIYYQLGSNEKVSIQDRWMYFSFAAVVFALASDEVGSLHERVSTIGGWLALLPFAIVGSSIFFYATYRMLTVRNHITSGILVLTSLFLFVGVAGLERLEGIQYFQVDWVARARLVVEEGIELFATSLLLLSAVILRAQQATKSANSVSIVTSPSSLLGITQIIVLGLLLHWLITVIWMPYLWNNRIGEPAYLFPMFTFALLAFYILQQANSSHKKLLYPIALTTLVVSAGQLYNIGEFVDAWTGIMPNRLYDNTMAIYIWTCAPLLIWLWHKLPTHEFVKFLLALGAILLLLRNGLELFETYYIYSGTLAGAALLLTLRSQQIHPAGIK